MLLFYNNISFENYTSKNVWKLINNNLNNLRMILEIRKINIDTQRYLLKFFIFQGMNNKVNFSLNKKG